MKQPTAPINPELSTEDGQNYRLQNISEIEKQLIAERQTRKSLYKKYKRAINFTDGIDTALISASVILGSLGMVIPPLLPLEIAAAICGVTGVCVKFVKRKLYTKTQKHDQIRTIAKTKLNSIKDLISKALQDGKIGESEFKMILCELEKYNTLKHDIKEKKVRDKQRPKKKKQLIEQRRQEALAAIQNNIKSTC